MAVAGQRNAIFSDQHSAENPLGCYDSPWLIPISTGDTKNLI